MIIKSMTDVELTLLPVGAEKFGINLLDYKKLTRLYCMNGGYHLQILPDGTVAGQRDEHDIHTILRVKAVDHGLVVIKGMEADRYLAMNEEGQLHSVSTITDECYFLEKIEENHHNTYLAHKYGNKSWYVGLKKNGKTKRGSRTHIGQKAIFFLPRRIDDPRE